MEMNNNWNTGYPRRIIKSHTPSHVYEFAYMHVYKYRGQLRMDKWKSKTESC